jgi:hypothetical protein
MKLSALLLALLVAGCGLGYDTDKTVTDAPPSIESTKLVKQIDVCITSADGRYIVTEEGVCLNPGYKIEVEETIKPPKQQYKPPPPPAPAPEMPPARAYASKPIELITAVESAIVASSAVKPLPKKTHKPYVPKVQSTPIAKAKPTKTSADEVLNQLTLASVAFVIPDRATLGDRLKAELLIDFTEAAKDLERKLSLEGTTASGEILVSKIVTAKIFAPEFSVINITPEKQALSKLSNTKWNWELVPLKAGNHEVTLSISAHVKVDGTSAERYIGTYNKRIAIKVTPTQVMGSWFNRNWQWLASTLIVPFAIWRWQKRKRRKEAEEELNSSLN